MELDKIIPSERSQTQKEKSGYAFTSMWILAVKSMITKL